MMNPHMSAGPGQHMNPNLPHHTHSRRQMEYQGYPLPAQPQPPMHHPYAHYPHPAQYYAQQPPGPPQYQMPRWQPSYPPPQAYMQPPVPQQIPHQPRSPMVVTSQPYSQSMTPVRQTPVPPPPAAQQPQPIPSPRPIPQQAPQQAQTPVALPSPAPTPTPKQELEDHVKEREPSPTPAPSTRRLSDPLAKAPLYKIPFYPDLPKHYPPDADFPVRSRRLRRRRQNLLNMDAVVIPPRLSTDDEMHEKTPDEGASETSTIAAPSEPETPATSHAPSESDFSQIAAPAAPVQVPVTSPKAVSAQTQHGRRDTRTAIAVPNIPGFQKAKPSPPSADKSESKTSPPDSATIPSEELKSVILEEDNAAEETTTATPVAEPVKSAPKSWADLVKRNAPAAASTANQGTGVTTNGVVLPKSASLADALKQYSTQIDAKLSFLEPRGLVNTGNMCYMNSILQVLIFCVPFYNFLDQVRQRTVHSMKSDTPLVDAMIMFMKEFRVLASAESVDVLRMLLTQQQLEQYGEPVTPEYVYDAIRKLDRFNSMRRGHQQDAEEFLGFLLEGLHDECVAVMQGQVDSKGEESEVTSPTSSSAGTDGWFEVGPKQKSSITRTAGQQDAPSPITKIFGGHLRSELRVPGLQQSVTLEPYKPLQLDIGAPHVNNIIDALKGLTRTEALTGDFGGRSNSAKKQVFIDSLPPVLILHLKRFQYENNLTGTQKIWKKVGYPLELEIPKEVFQPSKRGGLAVKGGLPKYRLISVVYHHGKSAAGGHYTVDVLRADGREWIRMDDTFIRRIRAEDVAEGGAEEDPKLLAKALEQHKAEQELQKQRNMYQGLDEAEKEPEEEKPWSEVNGNVQGHRKWNSVANTGASTPSSTTGKKSPPTGKKESVRDNKVAYILLYERMRG